MTGIYGLWKPVIYGRNGLNMSVDAALAYNTALDDVVALLSESVDAIVEAMSTCTDDGTPDIWEQYVLDPNVTEEDVVRAMIAAAKGARP